jgi:hypothetical protein
MEKFNCPYCFRQSVSPGGVRFHVKIDHPDKLKEFDEKYYDEMKKRYEQA